MNDSVFENANELITEGYMYVTVGELIKKLKKFDKNTPVVKRFVEPEYSTVHEENYVTADFDPERGLVVIE